MNQILKLSTFNLLTNSKFTSCESLIYFLHENKILASFYKFETIKSENDIEKDFQKHRQNIIYHYYGFDLLPNYFVVEYIILEVDQLEEIKKLIKLKEFL